MPSSPLAPPHPIPPLARESLRDKIVALLHEWVRDGTLGPGSRLNESALAARLGVSRPSVREAVCLLASQGFLRIEAGRGAFVTRLTEDDVREIFAIRLQLETLAAVRVHQRWCPAVAEAVGAAMDSLQAAAAARDMVAFSIADHAFHQALWQQAGGRFLAETLEHVCNLFFSYEQLRDLDKGPVFAFDDVLDDHRRMATLAAQGPADAIAKGYAEVFEKFEAYATSRFGR